MCYILGQGELVKSPESHVAQSHVAQNLSRVVRKKKVKSPKETNAKKIRISDCK